MTLAYSLGYGVGSVLRDLFDMSLSKKSAEDSSALQYHYQSKLNKQNYGYNTKLINMQNAFNEAMMDKANDWNLARWNESVDLANTAHQREMADLKSAGLNPILSANGGASVVNPIQSAQASSGNSQLSSSAGMPDIDYMGALSTAYGIRNENKRVTNELLNSKSQRDFIQKQGEDIDNQISNRNTTTAIQKQESKARVDKMYSDIKNSQKVTNATVKQLESQAGLNNANSARSNTENKYYTYTSGINLGKFGTFGFTRTPNNPEHSRKGSYDSGYSKGVHYEFIGGKTVPVYSY